MKRLGNIKAIAVAVFAIIALAATFALAQTGGGEQGKRQGPRGEWGKGDGERRGGGGHFGGGMFRGLDLSDEQKAKLQQIHQGFDERTKALREQLRAKHMELRQASEGNTFNEALVTQKLTEIAPLEAKMMGEEFRMRQDSLSVLTPEQKTQLEQRREQFKGGRGERRERPQEQ
jgi:Spy/CpxP family protein refolding chaperone